MSVTIKFELPNAKVHTNAIAMPSSKVVPKTDSLEMFGGIFDDQGLFIPESGLYRGEGAPIMKGGSLSTNITNCIDGRVAYGGFLYRTHYGHFLIESLARMWRLMRHEEFDRIIFHSHPGAIEACPIGDFLLETLGWSKEKITIINEPTQIPLLTIPDPAIRLGSTEAFAVHKQVCSAITDRTFGDIYSPFPKQPQPIYFSRSKFTIRPVFGELELEHELARQGWEIVYPEQLSVPEQIKISRKSNIYCGIIGSAMHNLMFSRQGTRVFYIEREPRHRTTYNTLEAFDKVIGLEPTYIRANIEAATFAGPYLINPNIVLDNLKAAGLIGEFVRIDINQATEEYKKHIAAS